MPVNAEEHKLLINTSKNHSLKQERNETILSKLPPAAPRSDSLRHRHLSNYNTVDSSYSGYKHISTTYNTALESTTMKAVQQSKNLPTGSVSCALRNNTHSPSKKQTVCSDHKLNSQAHGSLQFSIKIPINQLHKLHIDPERIACVTSELPDHSSQQKLPHENTCFTDSTSTPKGENASLKSSQFVTYNFHSSPVVGNILHLESNVRIKKTGLRSSDETKNIAMNCNNLENCNLDDTSTHTSIQTKSDTQHGTECCYGPVHFESSSSLDISSNCHHKQQSQTEYHAFRRNSIEKFSGNNISADHTSTQLNQKGNCIKKDVQVISKYVQTSSTETVCSQERSALSFSGTKNPSHTHSVHNTSPLIPDDGIHNSLCDCAVFYDNSSMSESGASCGLCYSTDWSVSDINSEEVLQDCNLDQPVQFSNPCQLNEACSRENCKCLLWADSIETHALDWAETEIANQIINSQNLSKISKIKTHYDNHAENDSKEQKNIAALSKQNFMIEQLGRKSTIETNNQAHQTSTGVCKKRQNRPSYKLSLDSNFSDSCEFAQHGDIGKQEHKSDMLEVGEYASCPCTITDHAYVRCCNSEKKNESLKKVHFSQVISPLYGTSLAQKDSRNCLITSNNWKTHVLQNKDENKTLHSKLSSLEKTLKSKLKYGTEPAKISNNTSVFDNSLDFHNITDEILVLPNDCEVLPKRSIEVMPSATLCTDYILTDSTPVTSITPTSSNSCFVNRYEMCSPRSNISSALSLVQISETNLHKTTSNLINTTFLNPTLCQWKNNSITSLCNVSALDVSNEMDQQRMQDIEGRIFLSEIPINTTNEMSSSTTLKSDSDESIRRIFHSNNETLSYPLFSNVSTQQVKTYADANINRYNLKEPTKTSMSQTYPMPVQNVDLPHKSMVRETRNTHGEIIRTNRCINNSSENYSGNPHKKLSENVASNTKSFKQMSALDKQCTNSHTANEDPHAYNNPSSQDRVFSLEHISQVQVTKTSMVEIYKNSKCDPKLKKKFKINKPNWSELSSTVNKLQIICNDNTEPLNNSASSETHSILAAQECIETLKKQLGIQ